MSARIIVFLVLCGSATLLMPAESAAQGNFSRRYASPSGPTLTPYLDYFREGNGVLDTYHNFIRPRAQMSNQIQAYNDRLSQTEQQGDLLGKDVKKMQQPISRAAVTGSAATYMNYAHYYSGLGNSGSGGGGGRRLSRGSMGRAGGGAAAMSMGGIQ